MSYKTILVHLNDERRVEAVLEPAMTLARRYNAHLIGMHVYAALPRRPDQHSLREQGHSRRRRRRAQGDTADRRDLHAHDRQLSRSFRNGAR